MTKPILLIISLGELGTALLETAARAGLFETIFVASRSLVKAQERANNAAIGAGLEGFFPNIQAVELDIHSEASIRTLRHMNPDYIFTAPSLMPWWKLDEGASDLPFASFTALHLALMVKCRDIIEQADIRAFWIGASFPDVINAVLNCDGFGPDCGIGNIQEPIPKIQSAVAKRIDCQPKDVQIRMVSQHAFEYYVLNAAQSDILPPYLLKATVDGRDVTEVAEDVLRESYPFPYDLHFNRVTASAGLAALRALTGQTPSSIHLPGIGKLIGGYPVLASREGIEIDLPSDWTMEQAINTNEASLIWDGIEAVEADGTIVFSENTRKQFYALLGKHIDTLHVSNADQQAQSLLAAL
ncbi:hypothetical protein [uncultured Shimia sp.]|uniref:hypothetical protein n=1 Tax=uncultured Shimia sp. TaxID=573152 RepID=UPI002617ED08|nr:hypothetical protein [uncultured Shimia sp.]